MGPVGPGKARAGAHAAHAAHRLQRDGPTAPFWAGHLLSYTENVVIFIIIILIIICYYYHTFPRNKKAGTRPRVQVGCSSGDSTSLPRR